MTLFSGSQDRSVRRWDLRQARTDNMTIEMKDSVRQVCVCLSLSLSLSLCLSLSLSLSVSLSLSLSLSLCLCLSLSLPVSVSLSLCLCLSLCLSVRRWALRQARTDNMTIAMKDSVRQVCVCVCV
jgi:hypothetical protein